MDKTISIVQEFHEVFEIPVENNPTFPEKERIYLRLSLILEELCELAESMGTDGVRSIFKLMANKMDTYKDNIMRNIPYEKSKVEALDALCDLRVVLDGTTLELGLQKYFEAGFDEVHKSNMSKVCDTQWEAERTIDVYSEHGIDTYWSKVKNKFVVYRLSDGKVLKGIGFKEPDLESILLF